MGIIDETYCGENDEWFLPIIALSNGHIHKNDRICQFRIVKKQGDIIFDKVDYLEDADRGGFGSTGEN
jgi:dUTP pyrophosphatase